MPDIGSDDATAAPLVLCRNLARAEPTLFPPALTVTLMKHKTALATAASVTGVLVASAAAMGANVGILRSNDDTFGQLSASDSTPTSTTLDSTSSSTDGSTSTPTSTNSIVTSTDGASGATVYQLAGIADITVARSGDSGLQVVAVVPVAGWTKSVHADDSGAPGGIEVELRSASEKVEFKAWVMNGQVLTDVERKSLSASESGGLSTTVVGSSNSSSTSDDDSDDSGDDSDDSDDDSSHGGDDEYEGSDDDD